MACMPRKAMQTESMKSDIAFSRRLGAVLDEENVHEVHIDGQAKCTHSVQFRKGGLEAQSVSAGWRRLCQVEEPPATGAARVDLD